MSTTTRSTLFALVSLVSGLAACGGKGSADQSYCEALCDWAVECAADAGGDADALKAECLAATAKASSTCDEFDAGDMSKADELKLSECNDAIAESQAAGECTDFTGSLSETSTATAPVPCQSLDGGQAAFDAAQESVALGSEEVCTNLADAFCEKMASCITGSADFDAAEDVAYDACMSGLDGRVSECISDDMYSTDPENVTLREGADSCTAQVSDASCDDILGGTIPSVCAAAFVDPTTAAAYAGDIYNVAQGFATGR